MAFLRSSKTLTSKGCSICVVCGGNIENQCCSPQLETKYLWRDEMEHQASGRYFANKLYTSVEDHFRIDETF
jgi:hypothetical protein